MNVLIIVCLDHYDDYECKACFPSYSIYFTYLSSVAKMWAKKNATGKDHVAKLVDDTYRSVLKKVLLATFSFGFYYISEACNVLRFLIL